MTTQIFTITSEGRELTPEVIKDSLGHSVGKHNIKIEEIKEIDLTDKLLYNYGYNKGYTDGLRK